MNINEIYDISNVVEIINKIDGEIDKFVIDSRLVKENNMYIGIKGEKFDGSTFYQNAFDNGAKICVVEHINKTSDLIKYLEKENKSIIVVEDSVKYLGLLAKKKRAKYKGTVVAITGSAGKTSTKDMIYGVLSQKFDAYKTIGNFNNNIGLPLTILDFDLKKEILVLEMGMNHKGEISYLTNIAKPDIAVITNVGTAHIGNLKSRENILKAKLEILEGLKENGKLIINNDNDLLSKWYQKNKDKYQIITCGINEKSDYIASNINYKEDSSTYIYQNNLIEVPIGGEHYIYNSLIAISIGEQFNMNINDIKKGIKEFTLSQNRMNIIKNNNITIIDDSYNANFDSLSYAIKYLSNHPQRKIAVIGSMLELGKYSKKLHQKIGDIINSCDIDILITVGKEANYINERLSKLGFKNMYHFANNIDAINTIKSIQKDNDIILIKASNGLNFKEIVTELSK